MTVSLAPVTYIFFFAFIIFILLAIYLGLLGSEQGAMICGAFAMLTFLIAAIIVIVDVIKYPGFYGGYRWIYLILFIIIILIFIGMYLQAKRMYRLGQL